MNNIKPTFVNRNNNRLNTPSTFDAIKFIKTYLTQSPTNRIRPNSLLYNLAVNQYNRTLKATLTRPEIPPWFCGKIDAETGELLTTTDSNRRVSAGVTGLPSGQTATPIQPTAGEYVEDTCLRQGRAGSAEYIRCRAVSQYSDDITANDLSGIDWSASLMQAEAEVDLQPTRDRGSNDDESGSGGARSVGRWTIDNPIQSNLDKYETPPLPNSKDAKIHWPDWAYTELGADIGNSKTIIKLNGATYTAKIYQIDNDRPKARYNYIPPISGTAVLELHINGIKKLTVTINAGSNTEFTPTRT